MAIAQTELNRKLAGEGDVAGRRTRLSLGQLGYLLAASAVGAGWLLRERLPYHPEAGFGYWLGIVGGSLMLLLLLYPLRKKFPRLALLGPTREWFRIHMILGVLGPVLVLYHCRFALGSLNSRVALICTLIVAVSGLVGRYLYARVHAGLYGSKLSLEELRQRVQASQAQQSQTSALGPQLQERLRAYDDSVLGAAPSFAASLLRPLQVSLRTQLAAFQLKRFVRRSIRLEDSRHPEKTRQHAMLERATLAYLTEHLRRVRRLSDFQSFEYLLRLWHLFHLPFFYMLILTALLHVLAVHMY
jgi:hypothetical protein